MAKKLPKGWSFAPYFTRGLNGVYCVCHNYLGVRQIIYVGQSNDIAKRIKMVSHPFIKCAEMGLMPYVIYKIVEDKASRDRLERRMIKLIKPYLNIQHNG